MMNSNGPSTEPCGTPLVASFQSDLVPLRSLFADVRNATLLSNSEFALEFLSLNPRPAGPSPDPTLGGIVAIDVAHATKCKQV